MISLTLFLSLQPSFKSMVPLRLTVLCSVYAVVSLVPLPSRFVFDLVHPSLHTLRLPEDIPPSSFVSLWHCVGLLKEMTG